MLRWKDAGEWGNHKHGTLKSHIRRPRALRMYLRGVCLTASSVMFDGLSAVCFRAD